MRRVRVGHVLCVSAGLTLVIAAFLPWAQLYAPNRSFTALQLGLYGPFAVVLTTGIFMIVAGVLARGWAAAVAMGTAFTVIVVELGVTPDEYQALTRLGAVLGGDIGHVGGFGLTAIFSAAGLAVAAAVAVAIEAAPAVVTTPPKPAPNRHAHLGLEE